MNLNYKLDDMLDPSLHLKCYFIELETYETHVSISLWDVQKSYSLIASLGNFLWNKIPSVVA